MKILYLHQYFRTPEEGGALRSWYLSKALAEAGHEVTLITSHNHQDCINRKINGVDVIYLPIRYNQKFGVFRRLKSFFVFAKEAYKTALHIPADICFATSTPLTIGWTALKLKQKKELPFFFEVRDLWPEVPIELGIIKDPLSKYFTRKLELKIYKEAEKIIALSPGIADSVKQVAPEKPVFLIPNMSDADYFKPSTKNFDADTGNVFTICYTGALGQANGLDSLLEFAKEVQKRKLNVKFILSGTGSHDNYLRKRAENERLTNVSFTGHLSKEAVAKLLEEADASYISYADYHILSTSSPNKLFDGLAAGNICISNTGGWIKDLIEQNHCGFYYKPDQPGQAADKIQDLLQNPQQIKILKLNARKLAESTFSVNALSSEFVSLFN